MKIFVASLFLGSSVFATSTETDHYPNFHELTLHEKEGVDYRIDSENRHSQIAVLAIHGGKIEAGSDDVARAIAGPDLSYYIFEATKPKNNRVLHITSTHFDDPRALAIATSARVSVSVHGFKEEKKDIACIGGGNASLRAKAAEAIQTEKFPFPIAVETPCVRFGGSTPSNITNRAKEQGVQIELSTHLRERLTENADDLQKFSKSIRDAVLSFEK